MTIRVLLADAHEQYCAALCSALQLQPDIAIVGQASSDQAVLEVMRGLPVDVVCMDMRIPVLGGIETTRLLLRHFPKARVIGLSIHDDPVLVKGMVAAGASGFVLKMDTGMHLEDAIRRVFGHEMVMSPSVLRPVGVGPVLFSVHRSIDLGLELCRLRVLIGSSLAFPETLF